MSFIDTVFSNLYFLGVLSATIAVVLSRKIFPAIIYLSNTKNLMDVPGERSMHTHKTATLGGIGVFITFSLTLIFFGLIVKLTLTDFAQLSSLLFGIIILLFLGIKDDLLVLSAQKKLVGQLVAASVVVILGGVRVSSLGGLLGIGELGSLVSILFTILTFIFIINAFNLADGIDGLAGSIAILSSTIFGIYFLLNSNYLMALVSFILIGSLISFLHFNLSKDQKIFMGDSGSMFIGFLLAFQGVVLLGMNELETTVYAFSNVQIVVLSVLAFPILDTTRVFIVRLKHGRSPFVADRNHIHHKLLDLGFSHIKATLIIIYVNVIVIASAVFVDYLDFNIHIQLLIVLTLAPVVYLSPFLVAENKKGIRLRTPKLLSKKMTSILPD